jgi:hypothetical protein
MLNKKKLIAVIVVVALLIIGIIAAVIAVNSNRDGVAFNSGTFSTTASGRTFSLGVHTGSSNNGIYNVSNNTWRASPYRANGNSRINYAFTAANLEAMTVRSTNSEGSVSLVFTQGDIEKTLDITGEFYENIDMSGFESGRIRLRLVFENARNVDALISW